MTSLSQLLAVEKGAKQRENETTSRLYHEVQKPVLVTGLTRVYHPYADDGQQLPPERTEVQVRAEAALREFATAKTRTLDILVSKDATNTAAHADLIVDGTTIAVNVPAVTLLALEKQADDVVAFLKALPVLDPAERWNYDKAAGYYRSDPATVVRSLKEPVPFVKWQPENEATSKHPPQVEVVMKDIPMGGWELTKFSGGIPADRKRELLDRAYQLRDAVKAAREEANKTEVTDRQIGQNLFGWLLG